MLQFSAASFKKLMIHRVGNRSMEMGYKLSEDAIDLTTDPNLVALLQTYFLSPFTAVPLHHFSHPSSLDMNEVYSLVSKIFSVPSSFNSASQEIAKILYQYSMHPKIKDGELYVTYFKGIEYNGQQVDAIGIFKSETKDTFLKLFFDGHSYELGSDEGVNINKMDKGCLVLNTDKANGYLVASIDNQARGAEAQYWKDEFLKLKAANDTYHATRNYMDVCKTFVTEQLDQEYEVNNTDKIDFLNKTMTYFKDNDAFEEDHFLEEVFTDREVIKSFKNYRDQYAAEKEVSFGDNFDISDNAVRKQARVFKSVLKLDKNFRIYIHGNKELIEKGYDAKVGKSYYKIYFDEET